MFRKLTRKLGELKFLLLYRELFNDKVQIKALERLKHRIADKKVAIVGNAESIFRRTDGACIDQCDCVVRINQGLITEPSSQGTRTDLLCVSSDVDAATIRRGFGDVPIVFGTSRRWRMSKDMLAIRASLACYPIKAWKRLSRSINGKRPSTGLIAVDICLNYLGAKEVHLFGFDWKETKTFYTSEVFFSTEMSRGYHDWEAERRLLAQYALQDKVVLPPGFAIAKSQDGGTVQRNACDPVDGQVARSA